MAGGASGGSPPQALILAAGVGRRLAGLPGQHQTPGPKAMLQFGGVSLIARHAGTLHRVGVTQITVVTGFEADILRSEIDGLGIDPPIATLVNPDFRLGSVVSLWVGRAVLRAGVPVILMDADVLYDHRLMRRLVESRHPNCLLLDREIEPGDEPVKLCVQNGRIVDFHKRPTQAHDWHGESVGFFRLQSDAAAELADRLDDYMRSGRTAMEYEEPLREVILASAADRFGFEDISGLPWTEIDFPEDVAKATKLLSELAA